MQIHIEALTFDTIIGLLDFERERPQRVIIDLSAEYDYTEGDFIDYAEMVNLIKEEMQTKRYKLLEEALLGIKALLLHTFPQITMLQLKIAKPDIISGCRVALSHRWIGKT